MSFVSQAEVKSRITELKKHSSKESPATLLLADALAMFTSGQGACLSELASKHKIDALYVAQAKEKSSTLDLAMAVVG